MTLRYSTIKREQKRTKATRAFAGDYQLPERYRSKKEKERQEARRMCLASCLLRLTASLIEEWHQSLSVIQLASSFLPPVRS
jgi:IS30 family transposase